MIGKSWRFITRSKVAVRHPKKFERDIGEVAVVTHGTSDIGSTCVENLLENGIKLLVFGGEDAKGEEYAEELRYKYKRSVSYVNFDVTKKRHVDHLFKQISTEYRPCDILINAPGNSPAYPYLKQNERILVFTTDKCQVFSTIMTELAQVARF